MKNYFIRGLQCTAHIGQNTWQKVVLQKLKIDIEWQNAVNNNSLHLSNNCSDNFEVITQSIIELAASKHWQTIEDLGEQIKSLIQLQFNVDKLRITISIPHAYLQTESVGITIEF